MLFKHYIWDFDGTLFDSYPHIIQCFKLVLEEEGRIYDDDMLARQFYDCFAAARKYTGISPEGYRRFLEIHHITGEKEPEPKVVPFPEIAGILQKITENGGDNYLYTNRNDTARLYCIQFGLDKYFKGYLTSDDNFPGKPAPDALLSLMKQYSLMAEDCVMIGDREIDGLSGLNAGMAGCLVTDFPKTVNGDDPLAVSVMPYKCRKLVDLLPLFEIE